jgi:hypothetical protein
MALQDELNIDQAAQDITGAIYTRLGEQAATWNLTEDEVASFSQLVFEMIKIAASMMLEEPGIQTQDGQSTLPWELPMAIQGLRLFAEGILQGQLKSKQMGLPPDLAGHLVQTMALDLYNQCKQVVVSTYGQENTPEVQFSWEQQVSWMVQTADNGFLYYLQEYEKQNGPVKTLATTPSPAEAAAILPTTPIPAPVPEAMEAAIPPPVDTSPAQLPAPVAQPAAPATAPALNAVSVAALPPLAGLSLEKSVAMVLFFNTLGRSRQQSLATRLVERFGDAWAQWRTQLADPQAIPVEADLGQVTLHLQQLSSALARMVPEMQALRPLAPSLREALVVRDAVSRAKLGKAVQRERLRVRDLLTLDTSVSPLFHNLPPVAVQAVIADYIKRHG